MSLPTLFDDGQVYVTLAHAYLPDPPMTLGEKRDPSVVLGLDQSMRCRSSVALFTKDLFRHVVRQFESEKNPLDRGVSVTGLDGQVVRFPIETGSKHRYQDYGDNYVCIKYVLICTHSPTFRLPSSLF